MRDAVVLPLKDGLSIVITSDNSGGIGMKEKDAVKVPYEVTGYFLFRVAVMECIAAGAEPVSAVIQNFCGDEAWDGIMKGVRKGLSEIHMEQLPVTGSTESNFPLSQSAIGINVIGLRHGETEDLSSRDKVSVGLVGLPLLGDEVVLQPENVAPLSLFRRLSAIRGAVLWPVGSKGVLHELKRMIRELNLPVHDGSFPGKSVLPDGVDGHKSGGPGTCFLIAYLPEREESILEMCGSHFRKCLF